MSIAETMVNYLALVPVETWFWLALAFILFSWENWTLDFRIWRAERERIRANTRRERQDMLRKKYTRAERRAFAKQRALKAKYTRAELRMGYGKDD